MKTISVETAAQLIDELRSMKTPAEVLGAAQDGLRQFGPHGLLHFFAGRALVQIGRPEEAITHLAQSRQLTPKHHWAAYELGRAWMLAGDVEQAVDAMGQFLGPHNQALGHVQVDWAQKILDRGFELGLRAAVTPLYRRVLALGDTRYLTVLRAFEGAVEANELDIAGRLLPQLGTPRDAWSHLAVARYHSRVAGHETHTQAHALIAADALPEHPIVALAAAELLARAGAHAALKQRIEAWRASLPTEDLALLCLVAAAHDASIVPDLVLACQSQHLHRWHVIPYLYAAALRLTDDREALYDCLLQRLPNDPELLLCLANLEVSRRQFEPARRFCDLGLAIGNLRLRAEFRFKQFELACFTHDLAEAARRLAEIDRDSLGPMQRAAVARYHAECRQWREAMEVLLPLLADAAHLSAEHALLIVRAARQTQAQLQVLASLPPGTTATEMGAYLAGALYEDWVLADDTPLDEAAAIARMLDLPVSPLLAFKLGTLAPAKHAALDLPVRGSGTRRAVFFCADRAYVMPALVSLCSLLTHNPGFSSAHFQIVVDDELIGATSEATDRISRHYGCNVTPQPASELMPDRNRLASAYGLFTGGQQLAVAAYYRIYMARLLAERGEAEQILYIDSDTLIGPGFDGLLDEPVPEGVTLMARREVDRPEVSQAIARHGLPAGMYFNSGVLWFPRRDQRLLEQLDRSIEAAEQRSAELLFQDQCALNIGFAGAFAPLPERYNFFAGPHDEPRLHATPTAEVSMLHVIDRPKPWDSAYPRGSSIQRRWLTGAHALRRIVGHSTLLPLLAHTLR